MAKNNPFNQGRSLAIANANAAGTNVGGATAASTGQPRGFARGGAVSMGSSRGLLNTDFFKIHIGHIPTGQKVAFEGWVTNFSDDYNVRWNEEQVYGRMDPLSTYQGTGRTIQLQFDVPNDSKLHAAQNLQKIQKLIQFLYPVYDADPAQRVLLAAPLLTLKWTNLASSVTGPEQKLVGYINGGVSYAPDIGEGGFLESQVVQYGEKSAAGDKKGIRNLIPKKVSLGFTFTVLHTHLVGWTEATPVAPANDPETEVEAGDGTEGSAPAPPTKSFIFGGSKEIQARYPNLSVQPPIPPEIIASREEAKLQAADEAEAAADEAMFAAAASTPAAKKQQREQRREQRQLAKALDQQADASRICLWGDDGTNYASPARGGRRDQDEWEFATKDDPGTR